ncbi:UNVERIFIED_CONTAM: hypothetical protein FKN15_042388 [Acipenser sinensis]
MELAVYFVCVYFCVLKTARKRLNSISGVLGLLERGKRTTVSAGRVTYGGSECGRPYDPEKMESIEELIARINRNTAAQLEQTERWEREMGLAPLEAREREPTELELLLQKWEQAREVPLSAVPAREAPRSPAPEDVVLCPEREESFPESEEGQPREREVPPPATDKGEEVRSPPPPQPRPPPLRSGPALLQVIPCPLLLDTLPVCLDLPALDLELRSVHHRPQLYPWFPSPLSPNPQTSLGCCQTSLVLPLLAAKLPLGDRTSLRRAPGEDLCPLLHPPVPRPSLRSPLSSQWGPVSPVRGPTLEVPEGPTHPQARPWIRAKIKICGLEASKEGSRYDCIEKLLSG